MTTTMEPDVEKVMVITATTRETAESPPISISGKESVSLESQSSSQDLSQQDDFKPPDGGLEAWSQALSGCLVNMIAWG